MSDLPAFDEFYAATHQGREPFPWQHRLAAQVAERGWPAEIGVPTGLGKTGCLDIAVWALAAQADRDPRERTAATRTWYVVNRRLLVDAAYDHGQKLSRWLRAPSSLLEDWKTAAPSHLDVLRSLGGRLKTMSQMGSELGPLHITRLRGGADMGARVPDPSQPALVFATVPMFASRWLFQGYGSSSSMRPVDAALAGIDSLVLLDEAHLAQPLARLAGPLAECDVGNPAKVLPVGRSRPRLVALTATGEAIGDRFDLDDDDLAHPVVRRRLDANKTTRLLPSKKKSLAADMAAAALAALDGSEPSSCVVFANTVDVAREVFDRLSTSSAKKGRDIERHLLTGRLREREASQLRERILDPVTGVASRRDRSMGRVRPLVVVATQTLEVGADVDFDHLVTETSGVRSMVQRFGRLNRLGECPSTTATVIHPTDLKTWPVYDDEPGVVWQRLQERAAGSDALSLRTEVIADVLGEPADQPPRTAELLRHHLWDWAKTSVPRRPTALPEMFYDRIDDDIQTVSVLWRTYIPDRPRDEAVGDGNGEASQDDGRRDLVPPVAGDEAVEVPLGRLREAVEKHHADGPAAKHNSAAHVERVRPDGRTIEKVESRDLKPGDQVVLRASDGMYDEYGWNPDSRAPVVDLSVLRAGLVLKMSVIETLFELPTADDSDEVASTGSGGGDEVPRKRLIDAVDTLSKELLSGSGGDEGDDATVTQRCVEALADVRDVLMECEHPGAGLGLIQNRERDELQAWTQWRHAVLDAMPSGDAADLQNQGKSGLEHLYELADGTLFFDVSADLARLARHRRRSAQVGIRSDALDDLSFMAVSSPVLADHLRSVGDLSGEVAEALGIQSEVALAVRQAGEAHDLGKHERRFQRWLDPSGAAGVPLAKSSTSWREREETRVRAGWPRGGRHELLSARMVDQGLDAAHPLRDLLLHLVISHHGHGRPSVGVATDDRPTTIPNITVHLTDGGGPSLMVETGGVRGDLSVPDLEQPARFRQLCESYGYWGVALLEAIVRQADHAASAQIELGPAAAAGTEPNILEVT